MNPHDHSVFSDLSELIHVCSRTDSDATGDNHPGPGRTLGKGYNKVGLPIERLLSMIAEKLGKGPRMTAERIRFRREEIIRATTAPQNYWCPCGNCNFHRGNCPEYTKAIIRSPAKLKKLSKKIDVDCKRLVRYLKSEIPSTQRQSLHYILDFSVFDWDIRALLKSYGAVENVSNLVQIYSNYRIGDSDDLLLNSSRKALVCLRDAEINTLLVEFTNVMMFNRFEQGLLDSLWARISPYLHDPDVAFLVIRFLRKEIGAARYLPIEASIVASIKDSPTYFEWHECEGVFFTIFDERKYDLDYELNFIHEWVLRHVHNMPRVLESEAMKPLAWNSARLGSHAFSIIHRARNQIVKEIFSGMQTDEQTNLLEVLKSIYTYPPLQPILSNLVCPLDRTVRNFVENDMYFCDFIPSLSENTLYEELAQYIDSSEPAMKTKAREYINYFMALDIYRCDMMLDVLSRTPFGAAWDFQRFSEQKRKDCVPKGEDRCSQYYVFYRHFDRDPNGLYDPFNVCCNEVKDQEIMKWPAEWAFWLRVERGMSFSKAKHAAIVAGHDADGAPIYLAEVYFKASTCETCCAYYSNSSTVYATSDGMKPEDLRVEVQCSHKRVLTIPDRFDVPVLRYAPNAYSRVLGIDEESLFTTGPFSWKPAKQCGPYRGQVRERVFTVQEAIPAGFSVEELQDGERVGEVLPSAKDTDWSSVAESSLAGPSSGGTDDTGFQKVASFSPQILHDDTRRSESIAEMNELDWQAEVNEGRTLNSAKDDVIGHEFDGETDARSDEHPNDLCSSFHDAKTSADEDLITKSTTTTGTTEVEMALEMNEAAMDVRNEFGELAENFESCREERNMSETGPREQRDDLSPSYAWKDEPSGRTITTDLDLPEDLDACNGVIKDEAHPQLGDDNIADPQIIQTLEIRCEEKDANGWNLPLLLSAIVHAFMLALGIALGKYVF